MTATAGLSIGPITWSVQTDDDRYVAMLAERYRVAVGKPVACPQIRATISTNPRAGATPTDRIVTSSTDVGFRVLSDPIRFDVDTTDVSTCVTIDILDPDLEPSLIGFHLWMLVNRMLLELGWLMVHAAAVRIDGRTTIITGDTGAGKSTLTVALGSAGATVLGEDWILVRRDRRPMVSGVTSLMRVTRTTGEHVLAGRLAHALASTDGKDKLEFHGDSLFDCDAGSEHPVDRIVLLSASGSLSIRPAHPIEITRAIVANNTWSMRFGGRDDYATYFDQVGDLAAAVPGVHVERSDDLDALPQLVDVLLEGEP